VFEISALTGEGTRELCLRIYQRLREIVREALPESDIRLMTEEQIQEQAQSEFEPDGTPKANVTARRPKSQAMS
jgi:hypothetical protein